MRDLNIDFAQRISGLEVTTSSVKEKILEHDGVLKELEKDMSTLVGEVGKIRNALYFMSTMIAANVAGVKDIAIYIKHLLGM